MQYVSREASVSPTMNTRSTCVRAGNEEEEECSSTETISSAVGCICVYTLDEEEVRLFPATAAAAAAAASLEKEKEEEHLTRGCLVLDLFFLLTLIHVDLSSFC